MSKSHKMSFSTIFERNKSNEIYPSILLIIPYVFRHFKLIPLFRKLIEHFVDLFFKAFYPILRPSSKHHRLRTMAEIVD